MGKLIHTLQDNEDVLMNMNLVDKDQTENMERWKQQPDFPHYRGQEHEQPGTAKASLCPCQVQ